MRGFQKKVQTREYKVHQEGSIDKLPWEDYRYNVPIVFNYANVPDPGSVPPGGDPDDYPTSAGHYTQVSRTLAIIGIEPGITDSTERAIRIVGLGTTDSVTRGISIVGIDSGTHVIFESDY
jgi:hypothetical protein